MAASLEGSSERPVLETLHLDDMVTSQISTDTAETNSDIMCLCLLCNERFSIEDNKESLLAHLVMNHKFVIADVNLISNFKSYINYWRKRLKDSPITDFCSVIVTNTDVTDTDPKEEFYLLCDVLPEDKDLRQYLQKQKLEEVLACQQKEREDNSYSGQCLFCREYFTGNRQEIINHMATEHSFNIGQSDNIVYCYEFLSVLQSMLNNLKCLYCEKTFKDKNALKEHMRKKQHRKIKASNRKYDKYYIINYLELGKNWQEIHSEGGESDNGTDNDDDDDDDGNNVSDWYKWKEESGAQAVCLFCEFSSSFPGKLRDHMQELHDFNLQDIKFKFKLNFYQKVKLVNYIRRQVYQGICYGCRTDFDNKQDLLDHMYSANHTSQIPPLSVWDQPQYYFPTYENDNLLCQLDDDDDDDDIDEDKLGIPVISEDMPVKSSIVTPSLRQEILES